MLARTNSTRRSLLRQLPRMLLLVCGLATLPVSTAELSLGGIVLDRTLSRFGKDFSFYFSSYWRELPGTDGTTVVIYEQVYPQAGTLLWVELDQQRIFQATFGRRQNEVKQLAEQAILQSIQLLALKNADQLLGEPAKTTADEHLQGNY